MNTQSTPRPLKVAQSLLFCLLAALAISSKSAAQSGYYASGYYAGPSYDQARAKYEQDMAEYQRRVAVYNQQMADFQARKAAYDQHVAAMQARQQAPAPRPAPQAAPRASGNYLRFDGRYAAAPPEPARPSAARRKRRESDPKQTLPPWRRPRQRGGQRLRLLRLGFVCPDQGRPAARPPVVRCLRQLRPAWPRPLHHDLCEAWGARLHDHLRSSLGHDRRTVWRGPPLACQAPLS